MIDGKTLQQWGFKPGRWFGSALSIAREMEVAGVAEADIVTRLQALQPTALSHRAEPIPFAVFLDPETEAERANLAAVRRHFEALMRVPTIVSGAVMPDAMPSGYTLGTIPVGGVVAAKDAIHPGFHSEDICCSMAMTVFDRFDDPARVLDAAQRVTHFGRGRRAEPIAELPAELAARISANRFLADLLTLARDTLSSQGDGNHFLSLGRRGSDGKMTLVTHHGSRNLGAVLYKRGIAAALRHMAAVAPTIEKHQAWLDAESDEGRSYWDALQIVREWTKLNHVSIHDKIAEVLGNRIVDRTWNEHNFVFRRSDGLYYHGKGATPSYAGFSQDDDGRTLIPMNMAEPILVTEHANRPDALGFAPHGAGRNTSRTAYIRSLGDRPHAEVVAEQTAGLDIRFFVGIPDLSELPGAYKTAEQVRRAIDTHGLARVVDQIDPLGCIMAGDEPKPWLQKPKQTAAETDGD